MKTSFIGQRMREARKKTGQTIEQASSGIGISHNYLGDLERGRKQPALDLFIRISNYYGLSPDFFLQDYVAAPPVAGDKLSLKLDGLTLSQRKVVMDILDASIQSIKNMEL